MTLNDLQPEQTGIITEIHITGLMKRRLIDMGVTSGTAVTMLRTAPLGDPVEYSILGYNLCLRRNEAKKITVEPLRSDTSNSERTDRHGKNNQ
ncbi:MAG: FeoA family protein [Clostridia bacterium]|nr:FeoA family protein [Clostridia bacterium]